MKKHYLFPDITKLFACIFVIMGHCTYMMHFPEDTSTLRTLYFHIFPISNPIFFMVTGYFIYRSEETLKLWKRAFFKVLLPAAVMIFIYNSFLKGVPTPKESFDLIIAIITFRANDIYWYPFAYLWICFFFPLLKGFVDFLSKDEKRERFFVIFSVALIIFNEIMYNTFLSFGFSGMDVFLPSALCTVWGHLIFKYRDMLNTVKIRVAAAFGLVALELLRIPVADYYLVMGDEIYTTYWFSVSSLLSAALICILFLPAYQKDKKYLSGPVVSFLASFTYSVYLIHPLYILIARNEYRLNELIYEGLYHPESGPLAGITYSLAALFALTGLFFVTSYLTAMLIRLILTPVRRLIKY